jgi:chromosome partitioning related protein ParA
VKKNQANALAIISSKGGVGKTTVAANIGGILADMGQRVCLIDADLQPSLSSHYRITERAPHGLTRFLTSMQPEGCISTTDINNLSVIVSDDPDAELVTWLRKSSSHFFYFMAAINKIRDQFDFIVIDSEGVVKSELQEAVVVAADLLLTPIVPDYKSAKEFARGTMRLLNRVRPPDGVPVPYKVPPLYGFINAKDRTRANQSVTEELREAFGDLSEAQIFMLNAIVPDVSAYNTACGLQKPVHRVEPRPISGRKTPCALATMHGLVCELYPELSDIFPYWEGAPAQLESTIRSFCKGGAQ